MKILQKHVVSLAIASILASASSAWSALPETIWTLQNGARKAGAFVRLSNRHLVIRLKNKDELIPFEALSRDSQELARKMDAAILMDFVRLEPGKVKLGIDKKDLSPVEKNMGFVLKDEPRRYASITMPFEIKATEVTWREWEKVLGFAERFGYDDITKNARAGFGVADDDEERDQHPVTEVSWWDAVKWCNLLSEVHNLFSEAPKRNPCCYYTKTPAGGYIVLRSGSGGAIHVDWKARGYRLPTEAEWEYAWQSNSAVPGVEEPDGWNVDNSGFRTHPVRTRTSAEAKTIHDMLGNVAEWCWDWRGPPCQGNPDDPRGPETGTHRTYRGGSWADHKMCCRGPYRGDFSPVPPRSVFIGFRPVRSPKPSSR